MNDSNPNLPEELELEMGRMDTLYSEGDYAELEVRALALTARIPSLGFGWSVLGTALQMQSKESIYAVRRAAELLPDDVDAHCNLGRVLMAMGEYSEAVVCYRRAVEISPISPELHTNFANALSASNSLEAAAVHYREALRLKPNYSDALYNFSLVLRTLGDWVQAEIYLRQAVSAKPDFAEAFVELGSTLVELQQLPEARDCFLKAIAINHGIVEAHSNLGAVLNRLGLQVEAEASFRTALQISPHLPELHFNMGSMLREMGRLEEAEACCKFALNLRPDMPECMNTLGIIRSELGLFEDAKALFKRSIQIKPDYAEAYSNLLFHLSHSSDISPADLFERHKEFALTFETPLIREREVCTNVPDPARTLRVGFVSADFRSHVVSNFFEPVLNFLSKSNMLLLHAYYNNAWEDELTKRLKQHFPRWRNVYGLTDTALAKQISCDGIDILIDLSGHTAGNRLLTFARKPAPVQASWIGYAGTTGLSGMDYYIADRKFLPLNEFASQFSEQIVHLPANAPFSPIVDAPLVGDLPALKNGYLTFGSFNHYRKLSSAVIALWAKVLLALPSSRMLVGGMPDFKEENLVSEWFSKAGISKERISFHPKCSLQAYLELHNSVDICLDTFPYAGATTTCYALEMGVPTMTMQGKTPVSQAGPVLQSHAGLSDFIAIDSEDFVKKCMFWATHTPQLADVRASLRSQFRKSAMGQPGLIATAFEQAVRVMWCRWCDGLRPQSFEVGAERF
jgi:protein O-GlcNAc transferase